MKTFKIALFALVALIAPAIGLAVDVPPFHPVVVNNVITAVGTQKPTVDLSGVPDGVTTVDVLDGDGVTVKGKAKISVTSDPVTHAKTFTVLEFIPN
jgi:hypothetical protein